MTSAHGHPPATEPAQTLPLPDPVEARLDEALKETFPASDPVSIYVKPRLTPLQEGREYGRAPRRRP